MRRLIKWLLILGVVLAMNLYNSVMLPMKVLFMWSDQIAKGHLHVSLDIPGNNEMGRLAQNFNDMVQNLSRHNQEQVDKERAKIVLERQKERELEMEPVSMKASDLESFVPMARLAPMHFQLQRKQSKSGAVTSRIPSKKKKPLPFRRGFLISQGNLEN